MFHCFCLFHFVLFIIFIFQHSNIPGCLILILLFVFYASFDVITVPAELFLCFSGVKCGQLEGESPVVAVGGSFRLPYPYWLAAHRGVEHSWAKQTSSAAVNQSGVATLFGDQYLLNFPRYSLGA